MNMSGLSVFRDANNTFSFSPIEWYNVSDRFNKLYHCLSDEPECIIYFIQAEPNR